MCLRSQLAIHQVWREYIDDLPEWDRTLFQWLEFLDCEPFDLMEALRDDAEAGIEIIFVSDGSAGDGLQSQTAFYSGLTYYLYKVGHHQKKSQVSD